MTVRARDGLVLVLALGVATGAARAQSERSEKADSVVYRVKQGDTLGLIASEFYGDRSKGVFIREQNRLKPGKKLSTGERLRVPVLREITTAPGDSFVTLADTMLGDARRAPFIADLNNMAPEASLPAGIPILIPFAVTHVADGKETLASLAGTFYGSEKQGDVLKVYNFLEKATLDKGDQIEIPSFNVRVHASKLGAPDAEAKARRQKRVEQAAKAATVIPAAKHAWRVGDYAAVRAALVDIDTEYLDLDAAIEAGILLGCAHVAFDETKEAAAAFKRVIARAPNHVLRRLDHSPKILAVWKQAGGQIE
ncbi:MAG TPA: LysM peptidoglycan-binding domain-containing protein [Kofleriaceae bacterium]|nr:LysM peptidoglycan-binding domain-containing protein [Kofleriaceae bacterium]